ncbi:MAG TPA: chorismate synthase, partial [Candidatus Korarchaeota archaeon]|nr:chorismate synthase [Candidatus Korarchaeota archaeon]
IGGITTGEPVVVRVAFKPTASIAKPQRTVDLEEMKETEIIVKGRHDPCIVPRAVVVVESMLAFVLADHAVRAGLIPNVLR